MQEQTQPIKYKRRRRHRVDGAGNLTEQKIKNTAERLHLQARPGESWAKFARRVADALTAEESQS